ncbi:MAG: hypothetical protein IJA75_03160 [Oscillospiraceae bacterium]|nr:hypothetical protein [Oscillospiraceae bacterium]
MTLEKAAALLTKEYERAMERDDVLNPVAWALYRVWKKADEGTPWDEIEPEQLQHVAVNTNPLTSAERQACFRLGQMDIQQSVLQMLKDLVLNLTGNAQDALIDAACMVANMQVLGSDTGGACDG